MTKMEATDLVYELIESVREHERRRDIHYFAQYEECRARVVAALVDDTAEGKLR